LLWFVLFGLFSNDWLGGGGGGGGGEGPDVSKGSLFMQLTYLYRFVFALLAIWLV